MSQHARLSASAAERWMNCAGSVDLAAQRPGTTSEQAAQGTLAHALAKECLVSGMPASVYAGKTYKQDGFDFTCDEEMVEGVQLYLDTCAELKLKTHGVELSLTEALQTWDPDMGGTADYATYDPATKLLRVVDFKYGAGMFVSADFNKQLMVYAFGAMLAVKQPVNAVEVYIVQPRYEGVEPVRMQLFPAWDLMEFASEAAIAAKATRQPNAPLVAGAWCKKTFCPNTAVCPELERMQHEMVKSEFAAVVPFDGRRLADSLAAIPLVEERIKAIKEFAYARAVAGDAIPGYKLVEKRPRRHWTDEKAVIKWAKERAIEPFVEPELKSPAQLEKALKKPEKTELAAFTVSISSGTTLVPEADSRPAVSNQVTVDDFDVIDNFVAPKQLTAANLFD